MSSAAQAREPALFSTQQVCNQLRPLKVSPRKLQWLDEKGVLDVLHEGHRRMWTRTDVDLVELIARLRLAGITLQRIRKYLPQLRRYASMYGVPTYVAMTGKAVVMCFDDAAEIERLLRGRIKSFQLAVLK